MTHDAYSTKRVTVWPEKRLHPTNDEAPAEGYAIKYQDGYKSWCPKDVYERDYQPVTAMSFGHALHALEHGKKVCRSGWNGKGRWLALSCPESKEVPASAFWNEHNAEFAREQGGEATVRPSITMETADGKILRGWLASQTDMLAKEKLQ